MHSAAVGKRPEKAPLGAFFSPVRFVDTRAVTPLTAR
jgi:hypothetical protein